MLNKDLKKDLFVVSCRQMRLRLRYVLIKRSTIFSESQTQHKHFIPAVRHGGVEMSCSPLAAATDSTMSSCREPDSCLKGRITCLHRNQVKLLLFYFWSSQR